MTAGPLQDCIILLLFRGGDKRLELVAPLVKVRGLSAILLVDPGEVLLVEFVRRQTEILLNDLGRGLQLCVGVNHVEKLVFTPFFADEVADAAGLEIGDHDLAG